MRPAGCWGILRCCWPMAVTASATGPSCETSPSCSVRWPRPRPPGGWSNRSLVTSSPGRHPRRPRQARGRAWTAGAHPDTDLLVVDVDGTLLDAHSDKQGAAGTYKHGYGFYPLVAFLDRGAGTGEALSGMLRPGNAGSNTAVDHIQVTDLALAQLPSAARDQPSWCGPTPAAPPRLHRPPAPAGRRVLDQPAGRRTRPRCGAGRTHRCLAAGDRPRRPAAAWRRVAELATLDLAGWPPGTRAICRREDPHPGAQLCFTDADGTASRSSSPTSPTRPGRPGAASPSARPR